MRAPSLGREDPLEKELATHSGIPACQFHRQKSLTGCSPWGHKESDTTERLSRHAYDPDTLGPWG